MKRKIDIRVVLMLVGICFIGFLTFLTRSYYNNVLDKIGVDNMENVKKYKYHFVLIVDNGETPFWQDVFASTKKEAEKNGVLLELWGNNQAENYSVADFMEMGIAARVDGIILEYTGQRQLESKIALAKEAGIPVVTVLKDATNSGRISYVGVNSYQLGQEYGRKIEGLLNKDEEQARVMILTHDNSADSSQSQIYNQINNILVTSEQSPHIIMEERKINITGNFDVEETVWNIFQSQEGPPDIFVCMDETDTEAVYQAMIDFNMVGEVQVIGYYYSDQILEAIEKGIVPTTLIIDTEQIGKYSIQALMEYLKEGRANSFYSVDLQFVDQSNVKEYLNKLEGADETEEK